MDFLRRKLARLGIVVSLGGGIVGGGAMLLGVDEARAIAARVRSFASRRDAP